MAIITTCYRPSGETQFHKSFSNSRQISMKKCTFKPAKVREAIRDTEEDEDEAISNMDDSVICYKKGNKLSNSHAFAAPLRPRFCCYLTKTKHNLALHFSLYLFFLIPFIELYNRRATVIKVIIH
ncbi:hypothetical protein L2E82_31425 [Cichorium intybus]|uniref:Uncharacterized protein n=1 Tax=Cichorium intybus TaxID=13427 RepID=A0ACB9D384_CICIN|nr:hypothetical protein L2E82_31425 [Cichorium intybus]